MRGLWDYVRVRVRFGPGLRSCAVQSLIRFDVDPVWFLVRFGKVLVKFKDQGSVLCSVQGVVWFGVLFGSIFMFGFVRFSGISLFGLCFGVRSCTKQNKTRKLKFSL